MAAASTSDDWDRPFTDEELREIDAAALSADATYSSSGQKRHAPNHPIDASDDSHKRTRRRMPESLFTFRRQNPNTFSLAPCHRNSIPNSNFNHSSYQGDLMPKYQEMAFKGRIVYSRTLAEVEKSAEELLNFVEAKRRKEGQVILGFDIEWRPNFRRGVAPTKAAVVQICGDNSVCYVMHIIHSGIPQNLQRLLDNPTSLKVGVSIANDAVKMFKDHNVSVKALEDLSHLANQKLGDCKNWSLSALTEMLISKQLPKPKKIRLGNWESDVLSKKQLHYAATDAYVSWYLYQVLKSLPEAVSNRSEEPERLQH